MTKTHGGGHHGTHAEPSGLSSSAGGVALRTAWKPEDGGGRAGTLAFRIVGPDGRALRDFDEQHGKAMHLMVVRRDPTVICTPRWTAAGHGRCP